MTIVKSLAIASVLAASLGLSVTANATDATRSDCIQMARQVSTALETAQPGDTADQARSLAKSARNFCNSSYYDRGVALYEKALGLLSKH